MQALFSQLGNDQLESLKFALIALYVLATIGVAAGVVLERDTFPEKLKNAGWTMLVGSLAIETLAGGFIFMVDAEIQGRLGSGLTALAGIADKAKSEANMALGESIIAKTHASGALTLANDAEGKEKRLSADVSTLNAVLDRARNELKTFEWRNLSKPQSRLLIAKMKAFAGTPFDLAMQQDIEPMALMEQIESALLKAGWKEVPPADGPTFNRTAGQQPVGIRTVAGLWILHVKKFDPEGQALSKFFHDQKFAVADIRVTGNAPADQAALHIWVGVKPHRLETKW